jgi:hypothetical protein
MAKPSKTPVELPQLPTWVQHLEREYGTESVRAALQDVYQRRLLDFVDRTTKDLSVSEIGELLKTARSAKQ